MDTFADLELAIVQQAKQTLCLTFDEYKTYHDRMISENTASSQGSALYKGRIKKMLEVAYRKYSCVV